MFQKLEHVPENSELFQGESQEMDKYFEYVCA